MSASTEPTDDTAPQGVVEHLDRARSRVRDAASKAKEALAPTLERASETAGSATRQVKAAGGEAVARVKRNPWAAGLALAGLGIGAFLLIRSPARARVLTAAQTLLGRSGARAQLRDLASRLDVDHLRSRVDDLAGLVERVDLRGLAEKLDLPGMADKVSGQIRRRLAA
jgi:hypothetical protein